MKVDFFILGGQNFCLNWVIVVFLSYLWDYWRFLYWNLMSLSWKVPLTHFFGSRKGWPIRSLHLFDRINQLVPLKFQFADDLKRLHILLIIFFKFLFYSFHHFFQFLLLNILRTQGLYQLLVQRLKLFLTFVENFFALLSELVNCSF